MKVKAAYKRTLLSILIPVRNESHCINRVLTQLEKQTFSKDCFEVLVIDGQSNDETQTIVKEFAVQNPHMKIELFQNSKRLSSAARNIAVTMAKGEYILFIDGHVHLPTSNLLRNYMAAAIDNNALIIGRPQPLDPPGISYFQRAIALARSSNLAHSKESFIYSNFEGFTSPISIGVMYHRSVFEKVGLFDETFDAAEDFEFNYRLEKAGYKCFTSPNLTVKYYPRDSLHSLFNQLSRYGLGRAKFVTKHPERFTMETLVPVFFLIAVLSAPLTFFSVFLLKYTWMSCAMCYVLALLIESFRFLRSNSLTTVAVVPIIILTVHLGLGWGVSKGLFQYVKMKIFNGVKLKRVNRHILGVAVSCSENSTVYETKL